VLLEQASRAKNDLFDRDFSVLVFWGASVAHCAMHSCCRDETGKNYRQKRKNIDTGFPMIAMSASTTRSPSMAMNASVAGIYKQGKARSLPAR
jgi:hypothetical protein